MVQSTLLRDEIMDALSDACQYAGVNCVPVPIVPFSTSIPFVDIPFGHKVVPYGSTSMIRNFSSSHYDKSGYFFDQSVLRTSTWKEKLGDLMLNHDALVCKLKDARLEDSKYYFIKPNDDLKDFTGDVITGETITNFYQRVSAGGYLFTDEIEVVIAPVKNIGWEFRLFMVGGRFLTGSSYRLRTSLNKSKTVPLDVVSFAERAAAIWRPDRVYVMDVCESDDGLKIVEFNCFNASGFYNSDVRTIVGEVSALLN